MASKHSIETSIKSKFSSLFFCSNLDQLVDLADFSSTADPWSNGGGNPAARNEDLDSGSDEFFPPLFNQPNQPKKLAIAEDPWASNNANNFTNNQAQQLATNPWQSPPQQQQQQQQVSSADPWAVPTMPQTKADEFDLFTSVFNDILRLCIILNFSAFNFIDQVSHHFLIYQCPSEGYKTPAPYQPLQPNKQTRN